ncbi:MAG: hypothetical protein ABIX01_00125 [Chitinophagaceae bacterium]
MRDVIIFSEKYGISAPQLADYLEISPSLVKMSNKGHRNLPFPASIKFLKLQVFEPPSAGNNDAMANPEITGKQFKNIAEDQSFKALKAKRKLAVIVKNYEQAINCMALMDHLLQQLVPEAEVGFDELWIKLQQRLAMKKAAVNGPSLQRYWQWKIDCCEFAGDRALELLS